MVVGLPKSMLYYRYSVLWHTFFRRLGVDVIESEGTVRTTLEQGASVAIDETCLSEKIWFGHVMQLVGKCDYILVPRISNYGKRRFMCTRFEALPDITRSVFYASGQKFLDYNVDVLKKQREDQAFLQMGLQLGFSQRDVKRAWHEACKAEQREWKQRVHEEETLLKKDGMKVLICAHSYVIEDEFIGTPVLDFLKRNDVIPIRADICDREYARRNSVQMSPTCRWEVNREMMGSVVQRVDHVNGVILMSAFPCGPDSMVNEMIQRKLEGIPILNIVLDGQNGTAGLETRLESFVDIIRFKEGKL